MDTEDRPEVTIDLAMGVDGNFYETLSASSKSAFRANLARLARVQEPQEHCGATMIGAGAMLHWGQTDVVALADGPEDQAVVAEALAALARSQVRTVYVTAAENAARWLIVPQDCASPFVEPIRATGVEVVQMGAHEVDLAGTLRLLARAQIRTVFVPGDGQLQASLIRAGLVDAVFVRLVPTVGGKAGRPNPLTAAIAQTDLALSTIEDLDQHEIVLCYSVVQHRG